MSDQAPEKVFVSKIWDAPWKDASLCADVERIKNIEQIEYTRTDAILSDPRVVALVEAMREIADMPSRMTWGEADEVNETMNGMEAIADAALAAIKETSDENQ